MANPVFMPALSPTMEKGALARWLVGVGDAIGPGDILAEVETDKATMEVTADETGVVEALLVDAGAEDVPVGTAIALIAESTAAISPPPAPPEALGGETAAPSDPAVAPEPSTSVVRASQSAASPLAARIASVRGLDLGSVQGSGEGGRILLADVAPASARDHPAQSPMAPLVGLGKTPLQLASPVTGSATPHRLLQLSSPRRTIAPRLSEAKQGVPHFYLTSHLRMDALMALCEELNGKLQVRGVKLSVNDLLLKAFALAIADTPEANVQFADDALLQFERVDVSMAVSAPNGLVTPVIRDAARKPLSTISEEARGLAVKAREGRLLPEDYEGGAASLSNLGMFGIDQFIPVINPPQSLVLGLGTVSDRVLPQRGELKACPMLTATGSFDHRAIDGASAARLMAALRTLVEEPFALLVT